MPHTAHPRAHKAFLALGLLCFLAAVPRVRAGEQGFQDPFGLKAKRGAAGAPAEITAVLAVTGQPGEVALRISAKLPPESYIYATTESSSAGTKITIDRTEELEPVDDHFKPDHPAKVVEDPVLERKVEKHYGKVTWTRFYRFKSGANPENAAIAGVVKYQVCDDNACRPATYKFDVKLSGSAAALPAPAARPEPATASLPADNDSSSRFDQLVGRRESQTVGGTWRVTLAPRQARPGDEVTVTVEAELQPGWHVYALDQTQLPNGQGPAPTVMGLGGADGLVPVDASFNGPKPIEKPSEGWKGLVERYHEGRVRWTRKYRIAAGSEERDLLVTGKVAWQMCNSGGCLPPTGFEFRGTLVVADDEIPDALPLQVTGKLRAAQAGEAIDELRLAAAAAPAVTATAPPTAAPGPRSAPAARDSRQAEAGAALPFEAGNTPASRASVYDKSQGLPFFLLSAVVAGFAALLTPCVFPMIPITVSFFQKQSEKQHHRPITMALVYCLGIIGTFTGLGMLMSILFSATAIQQVASNWIVNLFIAGVLVFFAFNLLGMFEIQMPSWLLTYTAGKESRGGFIGVLFMALTFTLTSFTCTFAFAGGLLAAAAYGDRLWPILGLLAFSAAFSLPFFFLALFPSLLQKLPRSGGWMNVVKIIMGLIELGAAFKFFGNVDTAWNGQPAIFDFHLMISAWAVISIAAALYLLGVFRLPHDVESDHIGVVRFVFAMSFLGFASYLGVGLFAAEKPHGMVWRYVEAFANPNFEGGNDPSGPFLKHGDLKYALDFERALDVAIAENKPLFLDFTGVTCTNCRYMEKGPMSQPDIEQRLRQFVRIQLFTDSVPIRDKQEAGRLLDFNVRLQEEWFGDVTLPSYVVIPPDRAALKDRSKIISALVGKHEQDEFARFLDSGWNGWQKVQAGRGRVVGQR